MKVLFLEFNSYPIPDAVGNCAHKLRRAFVQAGVTADVLTFRWDRSLAPKQKDALGTVYLADSFMYHARVSRDANGRIAGSPLRLLCAVLVKALSFLLGGLFMREDKLPKAACVRIGRQLNALCGENEYDWVIACGSPFCMYWTATRYTQKPTKLLLYYFDPLYYAAPGFSESPSRVRRRLRREAAAWARADLIVIAPEHHAMAAEPAFDAVRARVCELPFPNLEIPREAADASCPVAFSKEAINCVFLGTLYGGGREPEALLRFFSDMTAFAPRLRMYLIGDKFGENIGRQLAHWAPVLGERLQCLPAIPMREGDAVMRRADILVNIGNIDQACLPSKVFDLISVGKPILQLCQVEGCNTLPYISRYPLAFTFHIGQCGDRGVAADAAAFCVENAGKVCDAALLRERYKGVTAADIARTLLARMAKQEGTAAKRTPAETDGTHAEPIV